MSLISVDYNSLFPNGDLRERRLVITDPNNNADYLDGIPLYIDGEISLKFSSRYESIYESEPNTLLTMLAGAIDKPISGQFAVQGAQIWKSTDPLEISVEAKLMMKNDGKKDVVEPALKLAELCLPSIGNKFGKLSKLTDVKAKCLIPPGPNIQAILSEVKINGIIKGSRGTYDVQIGWLKLHNCIIKEASPTFSKTVDEDGFPISAEISISIITVSIPTKEVLESMRKEIESQVSIDSVVGMFGKVGDEISEKVENALSKPFDKIKNKLSYLNV